MRSAAAILEEREFLRLRQAYLAAGGLVNGDDLALMLRPHCDQPLSVVARWLVRRQLVSFIWHSRRMVPLFQFEPQRMALLPAVEAVLREFGESLSDVEIAGWFVTPNPALGGAAPLALIRHEPDAVIGAARANRIANAVPPAATRVDGAALHHAPPGRRVRRTFAEA